VALLFVVFRAGFCFARYETHNRHAIPQPLQTLRWKTHALHALLSLVPSEGSPALAGSALPGNMHELRLVGGYSFLELLPLV
jgi:uncharacterized membrane protein